VRDDFAENGEWTLEAGALVQASGGHACIDELDKMDADVTNSMHRAMEQQRIPINKAGINTTLPARTAIFAAANPKHGRWDRFEATADQIELSPTLLSRFSLIWKLSDTPDAERDPVLAAAMLRRKEAVKKAARGDVEVSAGERAAVSPEIDPGLLRKYVAYARREVADPVFADAGVRDALVDAFVELRAANDAGGEDAAVPVTRRKLPDFHRLAEAAARAEFSDVIEERHVRVAERLIRASLEQFGVNEEGEFDADIVEAGASKPQQDRRKAVEAALRELEEETDAAGVPVEDLVDALDLDEDRLREELEPWRDAGVVYEPRPGRVKWVGRA
jgi:replicative DNA helicase Mcm